MTTTGIAHLCLSMGYGATPAVWLDVLVFDGAAVSCRPSPTGRHIRRPWTAYEGETQ